jgi:hypothetical protein
MLSTEVIAVVIRFPDLPLKPVHWYGFGAFALVCIAAITYVLATEFGRPSRPVSPPLQRHGNRD